MKNLFYRVQQGDDLFKISTMFNIPTALIVAENNLKQEPEEGDILYIQVPDGNIYRVKPNDTALSIANNFGITESELLEKNKIPYVFVGEILII